MVLKVKVLKPGAHMPSRGTEGAAGADLRACCEEDIVLKPMERALVPTGLAIELPGPGTVALVFSRSGLAIKEGLAMANGVGVIDSDYRGEVAVPVINLSQNTLRIINGERIAQLVMMPVQIPEMIEIQTLTETPRGQGGFGSTGKN
ncbi:MAG: dUTP diphosphatase [Oscillospiraceae bacterium]